MEKLTKWAVVWNGIVPAFESRIRQWQPGRLNGELKYRDDLYEKVREILPEGCVVQKEYRHFGTTIDIWVKWEGVLGTTEIGFELKLNLNKKPEFDRLIGQIEHMEPKKTNIVVVLIGNLDETFLMKLRHKYSPQISAEGNDKKMALIHVPIEA